MPLRFQSLAELKKALSPDVEIVDTGGAEQREEPPAAKALRKALKNRKILEDRFLAMWESQSGPALEREYRFHPKRRWRFDFAHLPTKTAFEIQGGLYTAQSGHRSQEGVRRDYEKLNAAQALGWTVFQVTSQDIQNVVTMERFIKHVRRTG
jgi:hypothetical protein